MSDLIDDIGLLSFPGLRAAKGDKLAQLEIDYIRDLTAADVEILNTIPLTDESYTPVKSLRATHHALARLLAQGIKPEEAAATTGHSVSRVYVLQTQDRAFIDLVEHYRTEVSSQYLDVHARLGMLGLATIEELMERLEVEPGKFTSRELFALAELTLDRSIAPSKGAVKGGTGNGVGGSGVNIQVTFVSPKAPESDPAQTPVIDITATKSLEDKR